MYLKLKKIFWEITPQCYNCCSYCGVRDSSHLKISDITIKSVLNGIVEYPPEEIQITGGDPFLIDFDTHKFVVDTLKKCNPPVVCEIMVNSISEVDVEILKLYDLTYVSLNTIEELENFELSWREFLVEENIPFAFTTNFNLLNFFIAEKLSKTIRDKPWHIGFMVYGDPNNNLALYRHELALNKLNEELAELIQKHNIIISDNANCIDCAAGMYSLGLLYDGSVVPCLAMRYYISNIREQTQGNILYDKLKDVWYKKFEDQRFTDWFSCKHQCKKQIINIRNNKSVIRLKELPQQILIGDIIDC